jgi:tripartite-type tricarboxylate transporter receptor subunit TctC
LAGWGRGSDAQSPPDVEIIVPNPAGGSTDEVARIVAAAL